jgi:hypothetical protein
MVESSVLFSTLVHNLVKLNKSGSKASALVDNWLEKAVKFKGNKGQQMQDMHQQRHFGPAKVGKCS